MERRLRYSDLLKAGLFKNRPSLKKAIEEYGFPPGKLTGPNTRTWGEGEVEAYITTRPVEPKAIVRKPRSEWKRRPGRPRKTAPTDATAEQFD
jgi:predicted DNA-binding transcriptional regulator AlpA